MTQQITATHNSTLAIATYGLTKRYDRHIAVNEVELRVKSGEIYGLMGVNGAGKTSMMKMLAAAESPTKGEIYYNGDRLLLDSSSSNIKKYIGYLPDNYPLYDDLTVWDYLDYFARLYKIPASRRRVRVYEVLELVKLEDKRNSLIPTLSRGMKQRLGLARTIIHEPIILLLDEPISGLDSIARNQFRSILQVLQEAGMTIVIASPILRDLTEVCTTIGIMEYGFLVDDITLTDIKQYKTSQQILVTTLGELTALETALSKNSLVKEWQRIPNKNSLQVKFLGGESDSVNLLRSLIEQGLPIAEFNQIEEDWETILLKRRNYFNENNDAFSP
ncbi:ABC transporter related [Hyella patelloides LEGE 07179]|uniref:ABC transporter related n=1 Tax=Hyella patelloides LEGE 07179 TaxID=945734 RepID=A0A563VXT6_9CYAN|nr:ABC transporter ATP-binding protein [Hyella patelloides]VEP16225.1 ABC transporter related [Hyella patelloides LEGE 07179]